MARLNLIPENAENTKKKQKKSSKWLVERKVGPFRMDLIDIIGFLILFTILISVILIKVTIHPVIVRGISMNPTYEDGDVLQSKTNYQESELTYGKIIVFDNGEKYNNHLIKRVEGVPGDTIQIKDGVLYRNGKAVEENFEKMNDPGEFEKEITLKDYFVLGDNRNNSSDSRFLGEIKKEKIIAVIEKEQKLFRMPAGL